MTSTPSANHPTRHALNSVAAAIALALAVSAPSRAEVLAGSFATNGTVRTFADGADGDVAPIATLGGPMSQINTPSSLAFDPAALEIFVGDFSGARVRVFGVRGNGDRPALRSFTSGSLGQPRQLVVDTAHDEVIVIALLSFVNTFPRNANGSVAQVRSISWEGLSGSQTRLTNPSGLALLPATDELAVGDFEQTGPGVSDGEILFFPRTQNGGAAPVRDIKGPATLLASYIGDLSFDASRGELYALAITQTMSSNDWRIVVFDAAASGNAMPLRVIEGPATQLTDAQGIGYDPVTERLWVTAGQFGADGRLLAFPRLANGNVAPTAVVTGAATGLVTASGVLPYAIPDTILADGFEDP